MKKCLLILMISISIVEVGLSQRNSLALADNPPHRINSYGEALPARKYTAKTVKVTKGEKKIYPIGLDRKRKKKYYGTKSRRGKKSCDCPGH